MRCTGSAVLAVTSGIIIAIYRGLETIIRFAVS